VRVERLVEYPVHTLVFEAGDSLAEVAELVGTACQRLTAANVPHNLFIADCGARVFLFPNCFAEKKATGQIPEGEWLAWLAEWLAGLDWLFGPQPCSLCLHGRSFLQPQD
jgi:hypothetical protein